MNPPVVSDEKRASFLIVTYNSADEIVACVNSLWSQIDGNQDEILIIDNGSKDKTLDALKMLREEGKISIIPNDRNLGFGAGNNMAFQQAKGRTIVLVNPDSVMRDGAIECALAFLRDNPAYGICGGFLYGPNGELTPSARTFPSLPKKVCTLAGLADRFHWYDAKQNRSESEPIDVDWVTGAFMAIRREVIDQIGFFDDRFFLYAEETDFCLRTKQNGWKISCLPRVGIDHVGGASSKDSRPARSEEILSFLYRSEYLYHRKHGGWCSAYLNMVISRTFYSLVYLRHRLLPNQNLETLAHSKDSLDHLRAAWDDTRGGLVSPPHPWIP